MPSDSTSVSSNALGSDDVPPADEDAGVCPNMIPSSSGGGAEDMIPSSSGGGAETIPPSSSGGGSEDMIPPPSGGGASETIPTTETTLFLDSKDPDPTVRAFFEAADYTYPFWKLYPKHYVAGRIKTDFDPDGDLEKPAWASQPFTEDFGDIEGPAQKPNPPKECSTRAKMMWSPDYLYVGAVLESKGRPVVATFTERNDPIYQQDSDFEIFVDAPGCHWMYKEFEANAFGTVWNLLLDKPYADGGREISGRITTPKNNSRDWKKYWDTQYQRYGVKIVKGELNDDSAAGLENGCVWSIEVRQARTDLYDRYDFHSWEQRDGQKFSGVCDPRQLPNAGTTFADMAQRHAKEVERFQHRLEYWERGQKSRKTYWEQTERQSPPSNEPSSGNGSSSQSNDYYWERGQQMYQERQSPPSNEPSNGLSSQSSSSHGQSAQSWSYSNSWSSSYYKKPVEPKPLNRKNFTLRDQVWGVGDLLRVNFSRVEDKGAVNWTWQPQIAYDPETRQPKGFVDMHRPDAWGYVQLGESANDKIRPDPLFPCRVLCMIIFYAQKAFYEKSDNEKFPPVPHGPEPLNWGGNWGPQAKQKSWADKLAERDWKQPPPQWSKRYAESVAELEAARVLPDGFVEGMVADDFEVLLADRWSQSWLTRATRKDNFTEGALDARYGYTCKVIVKAKGQRNLPPGAIGAEISEDRLLRVIYQGC